MRKKISIFLYKILRKTSPLSLNSLISTISTNFLLGVEQILHVQYISDDIVLPTKERNVNEL